MSQLLRAARDAALPRTDKLVLMCLIAWADDRTGAHCRPGVARLAAACGITPRVAQLILRRLERDGWLQVVVPSRQHRPTEYAVRVPIGTPRGAAQCTPESKSGAVENLCTATSGVIGGSPLESPGVIGEGRQGRSWKATRGDRGITRSVPRSVPVRTSSTAVQADKHAPGGAPPVRRRRAPATNRLLRRLVYDIIRAVPLHAVGTLEAGEVLERLKRACARLQIPYGPPDAPVECLHTAVDQVLTHLTRVAGAPPRAAHGGRR